MWQKKCWNFREERIAEWVNMIHYLLSPAFLKTILFFSLLIQWIMLIDFWMLNKPCIPGVNPTWLWNIINFTDWWIWFCGRFLCLGSFKILICSFVFFFVLFYQVLLSVLYKSKWKSKYNRFVGRSWSSTERAIYRTKWLY